MGRIAALGESAKVRDLALAGVLVLPAEDPQSVRLAWGALPPDVLVVILTPRAMQALGPVRGPLTAVMP